MAKGITELVAGFKELHPMAYKAIRDDEIAEFSEAVVEKVEKVAFERFGNDGMGGQKVVVLDDVIEIIRSRGKEGI